MYLLQAWRMNTNLEAKQKTTVKGLSTPALSIKGSSGMLELGYIIQNKDVNVPAVYIGLQGSHG